MNIGYALGEKAISMVLTERFAQATVNHVDQASPMVPFFYLEIEISLPAPPAINFNITPQLDGMCKCLNLDCEGQISVVSEIHKVLEKRAASTGKKLMLVKKKRL